MNLDHKMTTGKRRGIGKVAEDCERPFQQTRLSGTSTAAARPRTGFAALRNGLFKMDDRRGDPAPAGPWVTQGDNGNRSGSSSAQRL